MAVELAYICDEGVSCVLTPADFMQVFGLVLEQEGIERTCNISLSLVSKKRIQELNSEWRGVNAPTDVISLECERPDDPDLGPSEPCELGDIFMSPDILRAQAQQFGTSEADEVRLMAIHSLLHLLGYDHLKENEAKIMEAREDALLALVCGTTMDHVVLTRHEND